MSGVCDSVSVYCIYLILDQSVTLSSYALVVEPYLIEDSLLPVTMLLLILYSLSLHRPA